jgi:hypothetical protein
VAELENFSYDKKYNSIVKRTHKKREITLGIDVLCTIEEVLIDAKKDKMIQLCSTC